MVQGKVSVMVQGKDNEWVLILIVAGVSER